MLRFDVLATPSSRPGDSFPGGPEEAVDGCDCSDPAGDAESDPAGDAESDPAGDAESDPAGDAESDPAGDAESDPA
ncbi:MAG: hypothetical protein V5A43_11660, partial [Haloarculaceae archaeon]